MCELSALTKLIWLDLHDPDNTVLGPGSNDIGRQCDQRFNGLRMSGRGRISLEPLGLCLDKLGALTP